MRAGIDEHGGGVVDAARLIRRDVIGDAALDQPLQIEIERAVNFAVGGPRQDFRGEMGREHFVLRLGARAE